MNKLEETSKVAYFLRKYKEAINKVNESGNRVFCCEHRTKSGCCEKARNYSCGKLNFHKQNIRKQNELANDLADKLFMYHTCFFNESNTKKSELLNLIKN